LTDNEKAEVIALVEEVVTNQLKATKDQELARQDCRLSYQELCGTARHYSNLRFAMFTVFTTILAALVGLELRQYASPPPAAVPPSLVLFFRIASLTLAFLFGLAQWRVSDLIVFYQEESANIRNQLPLLTLPLPTGHQDWKYLARPVMLAPFFLACIFWAWRIVATP
jgi:hypothetical protein